jgi:hypothetical protein
MSTSEPEKNKRGGCLSVFLIVVMVISPLCILIGIFPPSSQSMEYLPKWSGWSIYAMALIGVVTLVSAIGMWKWKKWGAIGLGVGVLAFFTLNFFRGSLILAAALLGGVISIVVLVRLVRPVWQKLT